MLGDVRLAARGEVWATAWPGSRRLLAFGVQPLGDRALVAGKALSALVDARNGRELRRVRPRGDLLVGDQAFSF